MKEVKRFALFVFTCVLTLGILTACGGGSGGNPETVESIINKSLSDNSSELSLNHDTKLDSKAKAYFDAYNDASNLTEDQLYIIAGIDASTECVEKLYDVVSSDDIAVGITERTLEAYMDGRTYTDFGYYSSYYTVPDNSYADYRTIVVFKYNNNSNSNGDGTLTNRQVVADVTQSDDQRSYTFEITNNRKNDLWVSSENFWYSVKDSEGITNYYDDLEFGSISSSSKKTVYDSLPVHNIGQSDDITLTVTIPDSTELVDGDVITIYYAPGTTYKEKCSSWVYTID